MENSTIGPVRVQSGRVASSRQEGRRSEGEVRSADPSDTVSLGVQADESGTGMFLSRFTVRIEDRDGNPDLKVSIRQKFGRGYALVRNTDGKGHETEVKVPLGSVSASAVENYFTHGGPLAEIYLDALEGARVQAVEIEKDGGDGRITLRRADGGHQGLTVGSSLSVWRA